MERHILAISGGGFSEVENAFIDRYLLNMKPSSKPKQIAFVATASHDAKGYIEKFYKAFKDEVPSHITIEDMQSPTIIEKVSALDIIYVGGGDTNFMINTWRQYEFDKVLKEAYCNGVILAGISAGAMCWFETCLTEQMGEIKGLNILEGSLCPHYDELSYQISYDTYEKDHTNKVHYKLKNNENVHFINETMVAKITA